MNTELNDHSANTAILHRTVAEQTRTAALGPGGRHFANLNKQFALWEMEFMVDICSGAEFNFGGEKNNKQQQQLIS